MDYFFFDMECAMCEKGGVGYPCEFGYVRTDADFAVLETGEILIHPEHAFDAYALHKMLSYTQAQYEAEQPFPAHAERIRTLLTAEGQVVIGHTTKTDAHYLASACRRYGLAKIEFAFADIRTPFAALEAVRFSGLPKMVEYFGIDVGGKLHNAQVDAMATMRVAKALCEKHNLSIEELLAIKPVPRKKNVDAPPERYTCGEIRKGTIGDALAAAGIDLDAFFAK